MESLLHGPPRTPCHRRWIVGTQSALWFLVILRISVDESPQGRSIRVEGRLSREGVGELQRVVADGHDTTGLDLTNLMSMDSEGRDALRWLRASGLELVGVPPALAWRLEEEAP